MVAVGFRAQIAASKLDGRICQWTKEKPLGLWFLGRVTPRGVGSWHFGLDQVCLRPTAFATTAVAIRARCSPLWSPIGASGSASQHRPTASPMPLEKAPIDMRPCRRFARPLVETRKAHPRVSTPLRVSRLRPRNRKPFLMHLLFPFLCILLAFLYSTLPLLSEASSCLTAKASSPGRQTPQV